MPDHNHVVPVSNTCCGQDPSINRSTRYWSNGNWATTAIGNLNVTNASNSNSIYGNSTTVQPPSVKVRVKTKYR